VWQIIALLFPSEDSRSMKPVYLKSYNLKATARNSPLISKLFWSTCEKSLRDELTPSFYGLSDMQEKTCVSTLKPLLVYHPRETLDLQWILSSTGAFG
jgi:hypothetical protein